jgi:hypothetical protein
MVRKEVKEETFSEEVGEQEDSIEDVFDGLESQKE